MINGASVALFPGQAGGKFGTPLTSGAVSTSGAVAGNNPAQLQVLFGQKDGNFVPAATHTDLTLQVASMTAADFNGDGIPDIALSTSALRTTPGGVQVLLGNGKGNFTVSATIPVSSSAFGQIVAADFNGDGKMDLAIADNTSNSVFTLLLGNGDGTFQAPVTFGSGTFGTSFLTVGDFNGDGQLDVAASDSNLSDIYVMLGNGDGTFQNGVTIAGGSWATGLATGDFNCDGTRDLAASSSTDVTFFTGMGNGSFAPGVAFGSGAQTMSLAIGDFNGDGKPDAATVNYDGESMSVLLNMTRCAAN